MACEYYRLIDGKHFCNSPLGYEAPPKEINLERVTTFCVKARFYLQTCSECFDRDVNPGYSEDSWVYPNQGGP